MYGISAAVWNRVAREQPLQTDMAKSLFPMDQVDLNEALQGREVDLQARGVEPKVASAYLTVAPLLWENKALSGFSRDHPGLSDSLPNVVSPGEAAMLATKEYSLNVSQQQSLQQLLMTPPT